MYTQMLAYRIKILFTIDDQLSKKEYMTVYEYQLALMGIAVKNKMYIHVLSKISSFTHIQ